MNVVISKATHERAMKLLKQNRKVFTAGKMREEAVEITDQQLAALKAEVSPQCTRRPADLAALRQYATKEFDAAYLELSQISDDANIRLKREVWDTHYQWARFLRMLDRAEEALVRHEV